MSDDASTLLALAEVAGIYIGIAALVSIVAKSNRTESRQDDVFSLAKVVFIAAMVVAAALMPAVFDRFGIAESTFWRISSIA